EKPASYRYVDGKNSFYLIDNSQRVLGILYCAEPSRFSRLDRAIHRHLPFPTRASQWRTWAGYVGNNADVNIVMADGTFLRWLRFHWHLVDRSHLDRILSTYGLGDEVRQHLIAAVFAASDLRMGTVLLIPDSEEYRPRAPGKIDDTELGAQLS